MTDFVKGDRVEMTPLAIRHGLPYRCGVVAATPRLDGDMRAGPTVAVIPDGTMTPVYFHKSFVGPRSADTVEIMTPGGPVSTLGLVVEQPKGCVRCGSTYGGRGRPKWSGYLCDDCIKQFVKDVPVHKTDCLLCARDLFVGGHVHPSDGSRG